MSATVCRKIIDLDPREEQELKKVVAFAKEEKAYLHIEVRRVLTRADA